jgi:hypothetical protein
MLRTLVATAAVVAVSATGLASAQAAGTGVHLRAHLAKTSTGKGAHAVATERSVLTGITGLGAVAERRIVADANARTAKFVVAPAHREGPWELDDLLSLVHADKHYVTIAQTTYYYSGGANGEEEIVPITYSAASGKSLSLKVFAAKGKLPALLKVLSVNSRRQLAAQGVTSDFYTLGTTPTSANFAYFEPLPNGLRIEFPQEDVASHAQGVMHVLVPWSALKGLIGVPLPVA